MSLKTFLTRHLRRSALTQVASFSFFLPFQLEEFQAGAGYHKILFDNFKQVNLP